MFNQFQRCGLSFLCLATFLCLPAQAAEAARPPSRPRNDRIGVNTHFAHRGPYIENYNIERTIPVIAELGVGWIRDEISWGRYESVKGTYALPERTRQWIDAAHEAGLKILLIFNYGNDLYADRYDASAYAKAVAHLAGELKGKVHAIEVINEPNNFGFGKYYGGAWNGLPKDGQPAPYVVKYTNILNQAAVAIKAVNPEMKVIGMGAPAPANYRMLALGIVPEVDGIVDHPYSNHTVPEIVPFASSEGILKRDGIAVADEKGTFASFVRMYRDQSAKHSGPKELWFTEFGFPTQRSHTGKKGVFSGFTEDAQARYTLRRLAESLGLNVAVSVIFDMKDDGTDPHDAEHNFGLMTNGDQSRLKPVYTAVQRFARFTIPYRVADTPPAVEVFASNSHIDQWPIIWDGSKLASDGSIRTYAFEKTTATGASEPLLLVWSTERAGGDVQPRVADIEITWPNPMAVKSVRAYDFITDRWSDVKFEPKSGTRLWLSNVTVPDRPVALVFSDK